MPTTTFYQLNEKTCLQLTKDNDQVMVTFLQVDVCLIDTEDEQKFIAEIQAVIERHAKLPSFNFNF